MSKVEEVLREKLSPEDFDLVKQLIALPVSRIRSFVQEKADEVESK